MRCRITKLRKDDRLREGANRRTLSVFRTVRSTSTRFGNGSRFAIIGKADIISTSRKYLSVKEISIKI